MTKELLPELGSGALREALEQRIKECRETAERWETESRNVRIDRAIHKDYSLTLNALANLLERALSLSSPIEPPSEIANLIAFHEKETDVWAEQLVKARERIAELEAEASSEIREAVTRETLEHWLRVVKSTLDPDGWDCDAPELRRMREQLETALAPSRQGAG